MICIALHCRHRKHCGTLEKSFAPKISGSAHCWRGASFRPIMTLHDEKSPKKVDSGCPPPSGSLQIEVQHQGPIWAISMAKSKPKCCEKTILLYIYDTSLSEVPFGGHFGSFGGHFRAKNGQILPVLHPISYQNLSGGLRLAHLVLNKTYFIYLCQRCFLGAILGHWGVILGPKRVKFCPLSHPFPIKIYLVV